MKTKQIPENWKEMNFLDCLIEDASNNKLKIQGKDFLDDGKFPIIDQGENFIAGYTNDKNKVYSKKLPVVIFGDHTRILKFVNFPFALGADGVKILVPKDGIDAEYFYFAIRNLKIKSLGYSRHYKLLKEKKIPIPFKDGKPDLKEQERIVSILYKAEKIKKGSENAERFLDEYLKSKFNEMFYNKGFEIKKFFDVFNTTTGKLDSNAMEKDGKYPFFTCSQETFKINSYAFDCEALLLAGNNAAAKYSIKYYNGKFNAYQRTYVLTLKEKNDFRYLHFVLTNKLNELQKLSIGTNTKYLTLGILKIIKIPLPPLPLQQKFAKIVEYVEGLKENVRKTKQNSEELFNSLMTKAFRGEL